MCIAAASTRCTLQSIEQVKQPGTLHCNFSSFIHSAHQSTNLTVDLPRKRLRSSFIWTFSFLFAIMTMMYSGSSSSTYTPNSSSFALMAA
ncbi:hypothetical protein WR25_08834 [Diploscapter pachys]|uniref:Uncharacterized protein n=1 Tax=Diploscapter pachys TaxID=2018661 RepID=A0A2A2JAQ7_9BILA|nr:hypothetical protein WR25_08834 [Diploscapter pachys]